jgi:lipoprotein-releasing system ATP-binding protein
MSNAVIQCQGLKKAFIQGELDVTVLKGVDFRLDQAETVAIVGASGSGKSTLLQLLGGLEQPDSGEVQITGQNLTQLGEAARGRLRNRALGFVYQFHHLLAEFTALENVAMPLLIRKVSAKKAAIQARDILSMVGLEHRIEHKPGEMSGGERQRAAIARAIVTEPACVLADEPTGNLDEKTAHQVFDVLLDLNQGLNVSMLMVTHNTALAQKFDRILTLKNGLLSES